MQAEFVSMAIWYVPSFIKMTVSKRKNTSEEGWWIVHRIVQLFAATFFSKFTKLNAEKESKPEVGSSKNNNCSKIKISEVFVDKQSRTTQPSLQHTVNLRQIQADTFNNKSRIVAYQRISDDLYAHTGSLSLPT